MPHVVAPGFIETDMTRALTDDQRAGILSQVPANRLGDAKEIASAVAFLASDEASYITGEFFLLLRLGFRYRILLPEPLPAQLCQENQRLRCCCSRFY